MGKTPMTYSVVDLLDTLGLESRPVLALAPLRVARDTWPAEALKWDHLRDMTVSPIVGDPDERRAALRRDARLYTTNYDQLPWLVDHLGDSWPFGTVIADESTRLKGFRMKQGGKRAHALSQVAWTKVNRWINLTGTPVPNGLQDLWGQMWFIDRGKRLGWSYSEFFERWFGKSYGEKTVTFPHSQREIEALVKDVTLTLDPKDWFDLQEPIVTRVEVVLPPAARKIYKDFEKTMFAELQCGTNIEVFNAAALTNKCLQIANGAVYVPAPGGGKSLDWKPIHDEKLEALESLTDQINKPILVSYSFVSDLARIQKAFPKAVLLSTQQGMRAFLTGNAGLGLAHPASLGHGVDGLQNVCHHLARFGHDWNLENRLQLLERIGPVRQAQAGFERNVMVYDFVAVDTLDEDVIERHETKRSVQDQLLRAMKRTT